ncbi:MULTISPECIES: hypothetical protein [Enterococcus]|uniref:hypothetical protein n=1 Tax=Enterococcus TaxID=1350 RepID=UPI000F4EB113|nr:hypothetical protein [Enterococcus faecium]ROY76023.1 hypothetical protein EGW73_04340 [Enterococcus faecium]ROZ09631.1 hypothetical protein EGW81_04330 [Enterococcus faecium]ROZ21147.1 hypothetical protein EGX09_04330 [Enterococcus faecium]
MENINLDNKNHNIFRLDRTFLFSLGYGIWLLVQLLPRVIALQELPSQISSIGRFLGLAIACMTIFYKSNDRFKSRQILLLMVCAFILLFFNVYIAKNTRYIDIVVLLVMGINIDFKRFIRNIVSLLSFFYVAVVLLAVLHIIPSDVSYRDGSIRDTLGFRWSTWSVHGFFYIVAGLLTVRNSRMRGYEFLILELINVFLYYKTNTRSPFLLITGLLVVTYLVKVFKVDFRKIKIVHFGFLIAIPVLLVTMYFLSKNGTKFPDINELLSGRLLLGNKAISRYGIGLLGQPISYNSSRQIVGMAYDYIDSSYLSYLLNYGIISTITFAIGWILLQNKLFKSSNQIMWISLFFLILNGFIDPQFIEMFYNYFIILMSLLLSEKNVQNELLFPKK